MRALHNGNALAFQARVAGSIPAARSLFLAAARWLFSFWTFSAKRTVAGNRTSESRATRALIKVRSAIQEKPRRLFHGRRSMDKRFKVKGAIFATRTFVALLSLSLVSELNDRLRTWISGDQMNFLSGALLGIAFVSFAIATYTFVKIKIASRSQT